MANELQISCPSCGEIIHLDETLAGPTISKIRTEANEAIRKATEAADAKAAKASTLEARLAEKERSLAERESSVQAQVNHAIASERQKIASLEREKLLKELSPELETEKTRVKELEQKLSSAQVAAGEAVRKATEAADAKAAKASELEVSLAEKERSLAERESSVQAQVNHAIASERQKIAKVERENLMKELSPALEAEKTRANHLEEKLEASQKAELELRAKGDQVERRSKEIDLEIARKVDAQRKAIREEADNAAAENNRLKLAEKDQTIEGMRQKLEEAQRKATQGSQQTQGEVLEIDFEATLRNMFPQDTIEAVKAGTRGGDIHQKVLGEMGGTVGTIFWEAKRAQAWSGDWAAKAKKDAAEAKAEIAVIVSNALPKGVLGFGMYEGVWCTALCNAVPLAAALRQGIVAVAKERQRVNGRETKKEKLYDYMIGSEFRAIVEGIALPFRELSEELTAEKRATLARWKRQERRIERVLSNVASLQGDLQGIAGGEMVQLSGFELEAGVYEIGASSESN